MEKPGYVIFLVFCLTLDCHPKDVIDSNLVVQP